MTSKLLPMGQRDDSVDRYAATLQSTSARVARSRLETIGRILLGMSPTVRPRRVGGRALHLDIGRVPWASVTPDDARHVRDVLLDRAQSRHSVCAALGALRGALRAAGSLTVAHLDALRVEHQAEGAGRSVRETVREWRADELALLQAAEFLIVPDPRRDARGRWTSTSTSAS